MRRLKILTWHIHGSYLNTLARLDHDWYLPVRAGRPEGYGGRGPTFNLPSHVREVAAEDVKSLDLDLIIYQTPTNFYEDGPTILSRAQRRLPAIYLEHNTPKPDAVGTRHPLDDHDVLLVHVTHYNRLMWDNHDLATTVIEHSVAVDPSLRYRGALARGFTAMNGMQGRPRISGLDVFLSVREQVPLGVAGMQTEDLGGYGDLPYSELHRLMADHRFMFSPARYTSLPLAVIEAMTIGMPVIALATTELPTVVENGVSGYVSCDIDFLVERMRELLYDADAAARMGRNAREVALTRFGLPRFIRDWSAAFETVLGSSARTITRPAVPAHAIEDRP